MQIRGHQGALVWSEDAKPLARVSTGARGCEERGGVRRSRVKRGDEDAPALRVRMCGLAAVVSRKSVVPSERRASV